MLHCTAVTRNIQCPLWSTLSAQSVTRSLLHKSFGLKFYKMSKTVCRTCLTANIRMHDLKNTKLQAQFEKLTGTKVGAEGSCICYICYVQLQRCCRFVDMSRRADPMFKQVLAKGIEIVPESLKVLKSTNNFITTPVNCMSLPEPALQALVSVKVEPAEIKDEVEQYDSGLFDTVKIEDAGSYDSTVADELMNEEDQDMDNTKMFEAKPYQSQASYQRQVSRDHNQTYNCKECCRGFTRLDSLICHTKTHQKESDECLYCDVCTMTFPNKSMYSNHVRKHTKPHACHLCDKTFSELSSLRKHKTSHSADKPYTCDICNKGFSHRSFLIVHLRSHTGEKPYACEICNKTFAQSGHKISHVQSHSNVKPFPCTHCSKSFLLRNTLKRHMKTHTPLRPYSCETCQRTFPSQVAVTYHMACHNKKAKIKQLFLCEWVGCGKEFSTRGNMVKHMKIHQKNLEV